MELSRLASRDNYREVEEEWKLEFIYFVLESIGIPEEILEECFPEEGQTVQHKIALRSHLNKFNVSIVDDRDGGIKIFAEGKLVAQWEKCTFVLKEDLKEVEPSKRLYVEIQAHIWTIFEDGESDE